MLLITNSDCPTRESLVCEDYKTTIMNAIHMAEKDSEDPRHFHSRCTLVTFGLLLEWTMKFIASIPRDRSPQLKELSKYFGDTYNVLLEGGINDLGPRIKCRDQIRSWTNSEEFSSGVLLWLGRYADDKTESDDRWQLDRIGAS